MNNKEEQWRIVPNTRRGGGREANYFYFADGNLKKIDYGATTTPDVELAYETYYDRPLWHKDGASAAVGSLTQWDGFYKTYQTAGGGQLSRLDGPFSTQSDSVEYTYDTLGRVDTQVFGLGSYAFPHKTGTTYDYLGRLATFVTGVSTSGPGTYSFFFQSTASPLLQRMGHANGQQTYYAYLPHTSGRFS